MNNLKCEAYMWFILLVLTVGFTDGGNYIMALVCLVLLALNTRKIIREDNEHGNRNSNNKP